MPPPLASGAHIGKEPSRSDFPSVLSTTRRDKTTALLGGYLARGRCIGIHNPCDKSPALQPAPRLT